MRKILFRGKRIDNRKWVEGYLIKWQDGTATIETGDSSLPAIAVIPETVGQYCTTDKNGKKIFEGDIIRKTNKGRHPQIFIANIRTNFRVNEEVYYSPCDHFTESCEYEVIGNIHDNPELLKGDKDNG